MNKKLFFLFISLLLAITSCNNEDHGLSSATQERKDIVLTRTQNEMVKENIKFAFSLFSKVNELETKEPNWIISPLSASIALSMTANGADGNSQSQILDVLGFSRFQMDEINNYYNYLCNELLVVDNTTKLALANSVWLHNDFKFHNSFVNTTRKMYDAEIAILDLTNQSALEKINGWSSEHTNNLIPVILEKLPDDLKFCLLNSLYFKGGWTDEFKESSTVDEWFTCADGQQSQVKMMKQQNTLPYCSNESFALAQFPYGNGAFSMVILLPNEEHTLEESLQNFTVNYWTESMEMEFYDLDISYPRFELRFEKDLVGVMRSLGITEIFDEDKANFTNLSSDNVFIRLLKQSTYIKVDEKGAEAAATTVAGGVVTAPEPSTRRADFNMNRPFAFLIKEESTGTILFMGKVTEL